MLWTVTWLADTRERFRTLVGQRFPQWSIPGDVGDLDDPPRPWELQTPLEGLPSITFSLIAPARKS